MQSGFYIDRLEVQNVPGMLNKEVLSQSKTFLKFITLCIFQKDSEQKLKYL